MKQILSILLLFYSLSTTSQTSVYHPFPDSSALWNFQREIFCQFFLSYEHYSIQITGDTTINNQTYHVLNTRSITTDNPSCFGWGGIGYRGAIRQDTVLKKIYYVQPTDSVEQLLYDFNLQVGDTVRGFTQEGVFSPDIVLEIDSILIGSDYRKRWFINSGYGIYMIEGVGCTNGLIELSPGNIIDGITSSLSCFSQNNVTLYPFPTYTCNLVDLVNNIDGSKILISPNPFHSETKIFFDPDFLFSDLSVYNSMGRLVKSERINGGAYYLFLRNSLTEGMYFINLNSDKGKTYSAKLIIN